MEKSILTVYDLGLFSMKNVSRMYIQVVLA